MQSTLLFQGIDTSHLFTGDSMAYHNGWAFSTKNQDNDGHTGNCAEERVGAWWYDYCNNSNLNGLYQNGYDTGNGNGLTLGALDGISILPQIHRNEIVTGIKKNCLYNYACIGHGCSLRTRANVVLILVSNARRWPNIGLIFAWLLVDVN